ncbi:hypothetical protein, partial [Shewanella algae]|uniref:hypothetical protein n=1 Tax=Shewanella algae TaxID=38313 RepID=UPI001AAD87D0
MRQQALACCFLSIHFFLMYTKSNRLQLTPWATLSGKNLPGEQKIARVWARNCPESGGGFVYCCKTVVYDLAC